MWSQNSIMQPKRNELIITKWEYQKRVGQECTDYRIIETYHDSVLGKALPDILYKFNKVFRVTICYIQAYIFHIRNSFQDLFQLLKVRRACA